MSDRFVSFLLFSRWACALLALVYHLRFLQLVGYEAVQAKTGLETAFYFLTGYGHEWFAVFFVLDGIVAGLILRRRPAAAIAHLGALYRILLPALALGLACDSAGFRFFNQSGVYTAYPDFSTLTLGTTPLLGNLFMLQPFAVPTFGSNGMLYLLSYLFWSFVLLSLLVRAAALGVARGRFCQGLLLAALLLLMPAQFLQWAAIWLAGVAVAVLGDARRLRPSLPVAGTGFIAALLLSRVVGSNTGLLPAPLGAWLVQSKYLLVGIGFAAVALALYPPRPTHAPAGAERWIERAIGLGDGRAGQLASFTFFGHFPLMMLLAACGAALLEQPLRQQPTAAAYAGLLLLVLVCAAASAAVAWASGAAIDRLQANAMLSLLPPKGPRA